jgi:hypothetical protein
MPHLISNLVEKGYTPYTARLAPKNLWSKPVLGKFLIRLPITIATNAYLTVLISPQAIEDHSIRCLTGSEELLEVHANLGVSQSQAVLHLRAGLLTGTVQLLVADDHRLLPTPQPRAFLGVRHPEGEGMGSYQAKGRRRRRLRRRSPSRRWRSSSSRVCRRRVITHRLFNELKRPILV